MCAHSVVECWESLKGKTISHFSSLYSLLSHSHFSLDLPNYLRHELDFIELTCITIPQLDDHEIAKVLVSSLLHHTQGKYKGQANIPYQQ